MRGLNKSYMILLCFLAAFVIILLIDSRNLSQPVRLFPLVVGIPTLIGLLTLVMAEWNDRVRGFVQRLGGIELVDAQDMSRQETDSEHPDASSAQAINQRERQMIVWTVVYLVLVGLLGFLAATALFLAIFWHFQSREKTVVTFFLTGSTLIFVYILFMQVLRLPLGKALFY